MAKTKISEYDATAGNNTDIDNINISEGMLPSNVNNSFRALLSHLSKMNSGTDALTSPQLTSVDINGGTIDGAVIGGNSAAAISGTTLALSGNADLNGDLDVDGTTNLDIVDIDGAVNMATTALVTGVLTTTAATVFNGGFASNAASTITTADNTTQLTLTSTDADADVGPRLDFFRNSANPADADMIGVTRFLGENDAGETIAYAAINARIEDMTDGTENGRLDLRAMIAGTEGTFMKYHSPSDEAEVVFNDGSLDIDFRVESDDETHAIFVNGGDDVVSFFTTTTINASSGVVGPDGVSHYADGRTDISRASGQPLNLRRRTNDGIIANFYKEASGTTADVGSIATQGGRLSIGSGDTNLNFNASANSMYPISNPTTGALSDGAIDLGAATAQFKDLYLAGNVVIGTDGKGIDFSAQTQSSASTGNEILDHYEEGTFDCTITTDSGSIALTSAGNGAYYTRIGRIVHIGARLDVASVSSPSGQLYITNLPFTFLNNHDDAGLSAVTAIIFSPSANLEFNLCGEMTATHTTSILLRDNMGYTGGVQAVANHIDAGSFIVFSATYVAA